MSTAEARPGRLAVRWLGVLVGWVVLASAPYLIPGAMETRATAAIWILLFVLSIFVVPALAVAAGLLGIIAQAAPAHREVALGRVALAGAIVVFVGATVGICATLSMF